MKRVVVNKNALLTESFRPYRKFSAESLTSIAAGVTKDKGQLAAAVAAYGSTDAVLMYARNGAMQSLFTADYAVRFFSITCFNKHL